MDERVIARGDAAAVKRESARRTRRSFVAGGVAAAAGYGVSQWIAKSKDEGRLQAGLRETLNANAAINRAVFGERGLAPTYKVSEARPLRLNGTVGLEQALKLESWRLQLVGVDGAERMPGYVPDVTAWDYEYEVKKQGPSELAPDFKTKPGAVVETHVSEARHGAPDSGELTLAERFDQMAQQVSHKRRQGDAEAGPSASTPDIGTPGLLLTMEDLKKLPKVELVTEFKCIEGWSSITQWAGVRLRDLMEMYPPERVKDYNDRRYEPRYVYMETPDGNYYGGYDMAAARHPQSLLVMEMGGEPLGQEHGAPLRLHMPIKYGYKQLKRVGLIAYMDSKPDDYWTKLGYDWYAGL
jgi:hypothetical protein